MRTFRTILIIFACLVFCGLILSLSYYNRFAEDCFWMLNNAMEYSPLGCAIQQYFHWQGTFVFTWFGHWLVYLLQTSTISVFLSTGGTFLLLLHSFYFLLGRLPGISDEFVCNTKIKIFYSILISSCFFYMSHDFGQSSWFLVSGATLYVYPLILLIYTLGVQLKTKEGKAKIWIVSISYFILGFSTLNYGVIMIFIYAVFLLFHFLHHKIPLQKYIKENYTIIIPCLTLCMGFTIMLLAPGNYERRALGNYAATFTELISISLDACIYNVNVLIKDKLLYIVLFIFCFFPLGRYVPYLREKSTKEILIKVSSALMILVAIIILQVVVMAIALGREGPYRTYTIHALYLTYFCALLGSLLGTLFLRWNFHGAQAALHTLGIAALLFINVYMTIKYVPLAKNYSNSFDIMISHLTNLNNDKKNHGKIIYVEPLPDSGLLYPHTLAFDTTEYFYPWVRYMEKSYDLKFTVLAKKHALDKRN